MYLFINERIVVDSWVLDYLDVERSMIHRTQRVAGHRMILEKS